MPSQPDIRPRPQPAGGDAVERRLRALSSACAALAAAVLVTAGTIGWASRGGSAGAWLTSPPADSFVIAVGALLLVLLAGAVHGRIMRPAEPDESESDGERDADDGGEAQGEAPAAPPEAATWAAARLHAYSWATGVSFAMLAAAAALGAAVAAAGRAPFYGLVICIASLLAMAARWPRRSGFDLALRSDRPAEPSRARGRP